MSGLTPWQKGEVVGQILYEVAEGVLTAGLAKVTKLGMINKIRTALDSNKFTASASPVISHLFQAGGKLLKLVDLLADATNQMCFVAGTPVHTEAGLLGIEKVRPGMSVLSRDEATGEQTFKPVKETFITHPDSLYKVTYSIDLSGDEVLSELVCTGEHPFFVAQRRAFVPAKELAPGDHLFLVNGTHAVVRAIEQVHAAAGETFTTYNFEVEDFHTYFVGKAAVWVHNAGLSCDAIKGFYWQKRDKAGLTLEQATDLTKDIIHLFRAKNRLNDVEYYQALGSLVKTAAEDRGIFPGGLPTTLWTHGPYPDALGNIGYHVDKHIIRGISRPDNIHDIVIYFKRAYEFVDQAPSATLLKKTRYPKNPLVDPWKEEVVMDFITGNFAVRKAEGPNAGAVKTFFQVNGGHAEWLAYWNNQF
jgi:hypothetical protein